MEIERINDDTVKFYISYIDIEERGFDREEIWYSRERSEELFWEMMDEVHQEEEFMIEGPLWIQVQALEKGLEVLVTKAQLAKDGQKLELPLSDDKLRDLNVSDKMDTLLDQHFHGKDEESGMTFEDGMIEFITIFEDFEDVISLSKRHGLDDWTTKLYVYQNKYYLYIEFSEAEIDEEEIDNVLSLLLEYSQESPITVHMLEEYGKIVIENDVFTTVDKYFA
ncbi:MULTISPECIES: adaptor protein MecA [Bacillaceae]|uniref:Adapter protein MecA n=2 Tax=Peribacillus simplex TaxID=1478 RepID=A0A223EER8_9BACI|nr:MULTISPECIES: adaptor protein MecA [Bacillaceae]ASS93555.1 adaptor protein MecA [Peribacillus simplex NBRC 15720 = DSM 1321]MBO1000794.1 adaptor protein MecA [Bacillus sp. SD075]MEC1399233.1 adaptor protein MecA [Peribacillus simplex]MED3908982.1 adaptor protein MecA [Peribacillus simplex]MED3982912.1 adaptor protein MecA [Peribacillus simplex]